MTPDLLQSSPWYLEGFVDDSASLRHIAVHVSPFRIGRRPDLPLCLLASSVSKVHAEIWQEGDALWIRDLGSRNGTFVNGHRIDHSERLKSGDILHFANVEFRLGRRGGCKSNETVAGAGATMQVDRSEWASSLAEFEKLFEGAAIPFFQPIVDLGDRTICGYEVLARSELEGLKNPKQMFDVAARLNLEGQLSRLFRERGIAVGRQLPGTPNLFLNTHPAELAESALLESLRELRSTVPGQPLTLEIHEAAITDLCRMRELRSALSSLNIRIAYDDFGAGQARLVDLIEVPPDYVKFDLCLIRGIHTAAPPRRQSLETLVRMAHDLGVDVLAEGVECQAEGDTCRELGFDFAQGYYYGRPAGIQEWADRS